jgi:isocitrate dehydrogenase
MTYTIPDFGETLSFNSDDIPVISDCPIIGYIPGDGIGPEIWNATRLVVDDAVGKAYNRKREIAWVQLLAGQAAVTKTGELLPSSTLDFIRKHSVVIKGPLTTPVGGGYRSLNVALRQILDLYACIRPVRYFQGVPSPLKNPEKVDMILFRENSEDVYLGVEYESTSHEAKEIISLANSFLENKQISSDAGIGLKVITPYASKRLVRKALQYAITNQRRCVTFVHKGNIMKYTEGAFLNWAEDVVKSEFMSDFISEDEVKNKYDGVCPSSKIKYNDRISDAMFQQILTRPDEYDVIATCNLNGDYLSDALAAQVGGVGIAPGMNLGDRIAVFEPVHGSAQEYTGTGKMNPSALILSAVLMLNYIGWDEAAELITSGLERTFSEKIMTYDFYRQTEDATSVSTIEFAEAVIQRMINA